MIEKFLLGWNAIYFVGAATIFVILFFRNKWIYGKITKRIWSIFDRSISWDPIISPSVNDDEYKHARKKKKTRKVGELSDFD